MFTKTKAFTLMEFMIVVIIIGLITAFTVPKYRKTAGKADEQNMITNLKTIRTAVKMYVRDGDALPGMANLAAINNSLGLSILDTKATYNCSTGGGETNSCKATHSTGWAMQFYDEYSNGQIYCSAGTCPTCPGSPGNCG